MSLDSSCSCISDQSQFLKFLPMRLSRPICVAEQDWPNDTIPVVSIFSWVFNHAGYIVQSIDSILNQKTTFPVEIIIHDDASTDGTAEIISEYEKKHPKLFKNILQKENQWSQGKCVVRPLFNAPRGKFIALGHGDDFWTDSEKLEIQFDYLINNPACSGCFHQSRLVDENNGIIKATLNKFDKEIYSATEAFQFLQSSYATNSLFFRNNFELPLPDWYTSKPNDMALEVLLTQYGNLGYIDRNMSDYRKHSGGVWSQMSPEMQNFEFMHRLQLWIDDEKFPANLKKLAKKIIQEIINYQSDRITSEINKNKLLKNSICWKITKPLRFVDNFIKKIQGKQFFND